jgi:hypothetical protein
MTQHVPEGYEKSIDPASVDAAVDVVCDDPGHARGKVARLEKFVRVDGYWRPWPRVVATIKHLPGVGAPVPTSGARRDYRRPDGSATHSYTCKLCGLSFTGTDVTLTRILNLLAAQGVTQINLKALSMIASRKL